LEAFKCSDDQREVLAEVIQTQFHRSYLFLIKSLETVIERHEPEYYNSVTAKCSRHKLSVRPFTLALNNYSYLCKIRELKTELIGKLTSISDTITRTSEVRLELSRATFVCEQCGAVIPDVEQVFRYTEPYICPSETCQNKNFSKFIASQSTLVECKKIQEIPTGSMPHTVDVILRGEIVGNVKSEDKSLWYFNCCAQFFTVRTYRRSC
jgi:DNA replication licensing factor MCM6